MNREIKYRVWDNLRGCYANPMNTLLNQGALYYRHWGEEEECEVISPYDHDDIIIEQYTGLKDKNGKEIYEGDIITETIDDGSNKIIQMYEVYWDIDTLCWSIKGVKGFDYNLHDDLWQTNSSREVIGNIHENPELLEGGGMKEHMEKPQEPLEEILTDEQKANLASWLDFVRERSAQEK